MVAAVLQLLNQLKLVGGRSPKRRVAVPIQKDMTGSTDAESAALAGDVEPFGIAQHVHQRTRPTQFDRSARLIAIDHRNMSHC